MICSARRGLEAEDKPIVDADDDSAVRMPLGCIGGRHSMCDVEDTNTLPSRGKCAANLESGEEGSHRFVGLCFFLFMLSLVGSLSSAYHLPPAIYVARKTLTLT